MAAFNEHLAERIDRYIESLFVPADPALTANIEKAGASRSAPDQRHRQSGQILIYPGAHCRRAPHP